MDEINIPDQGQKLVKQGDHIPALVITLGEHRQGLGGVFFAQDVYKRQVLCTASRPVAQRMLEGMKEKFSMDSPGEGIAFTIPVSSVVGRVSFELLLGGKGEQ